MVKTVIEKTNENDLIKNTEIKEILNEVEGEIKPFQETETVINVVTTQKEEKLDNFQSSRKKELIRSLKYLFFTSSAGLIQVVSFTLLNEIIFKGKYYWPCYLVALTLSVIWNFTLNRRYTFKSANNVTVAMFKVFLYYLVFTPLSTWWGEALTGIGWNEYLVLAFTMIINLLTEFTFCRFVVFRASMDTNTLAEKEKNKKQDN